MRHRPDLGLRVAQRLDFLAEHPRKHGIGLGLELGRMGNDDLVGDRLLAFACGDAVVAARTGLRRSARSRECADRRCDHDEAEVCSNAGGEFGNGVEHHGTLDRLAAAATPVPAYYAEGQAGHKLQPTLRALPGRAYR